LPPLKAFAHALNWMSQLRCTAALLFTNVLPLTRNGRVASPESVMAGAAIPPRAEASAVWTVEAAEAVPLAALTSAATAATGVTVTVVGGREEHDVESARTAAAVVAGSSTKTVLVTTAHVEAVWTAATARAVVVGSSTKTVLVTTEQTLSEVARATAGAVVATAATAATVWLATSVEAASTVVVTVASEMTEPVMVALASAVTVPVTWAAVDGATAVEAAEPQEFFWVVHSSIENPAPAKLTQAVNCLPQAAAAAALRSSKSSSKIANLLFFLDIDGHMPPRARSKMKKVLMITTFFTKTLVTFLPLFFPLLAEVVAFAETAAIEALAEVVVAATVVLANEANEELTTALPLPLALVEAFSVEDNATETTVEEALFPLPAFVVDEDATDDAELEALAEAALAPLLDFVAAVAADEVEDSVFPPLVALAVADAATDAVEESAFPPLPALVVEDEADEAAEELALLLPFPAAWVELEVASADDTGMVAEPVTTAPGPAATALAA